MTAIAAVSEKDQKTLDSLLAKCGLKVAEDPDNKRKRLAEMKTEWVKMATEAGFRPGEVWLVGKNGKKKTYKITHQDPDNPINTWKGIGNMPKWAREKLGKTNKDVRDLPHPEILKLMEPFEIE
jgi:H-NS histone family